METLTATAGSPFFDRGAVPQFLAVGQNRKFRRRVRYGIIVDARAGGERFIHAVQIEFNFRPRERRKAVRLVLAGDRQRLRRQQLFNFVTIPLSRGPRLVAIASATTRIGASAARLMVTSAARGLSAPSSHTVFTRARVRHIRVELMNHESGLRRLAEQPAIHVNLVAGIQIILLAPV